MKKSTLLIIVLTFLFLLSATTLIAANKATAATDSAKKNSPFLITGKLPHLTKLLMQEWDNPTLKLTSAQKDKLLVVRKKTISGVKRLGPEIAALEKLGCRKDFCRENA